MKRAFSESDLAAFRALTATQTARLLGLHCKPDPDYSPIKNEASSRVYISVGSTVFEIVETGPKWWDSRQNRGGGGAIDLVMHLYKIDFVTAVKRLLSARTA